MRLVTRSDFDGLACGALLLEAGIIDSWKSALTVRVHWNDGQTKDHTLPQKAHSPDNHSHLLQPDRPANLRLHKNY